MPELPEVETTRRGIEPHVTGRRVVAVRVRQPRLRWPVPETLARELPGRRIVAVGRRAKYLLLCAEGGGTVIVHLGMSGSLRLVPADQPPDRHDHVDLVLEDGLALRLHDPRRFGAVLWSGREVHEHPLLSALGPEPLGEAFDGEHLFRLSRGRRGAVKPFLMDSHVVVGVGNIYANEALYAAGVDPRRPAGRIALARYQSLAGAVRTVLAAAIDQGGTTLRDFVGGDGRPGYFAQRLSVYGREGLPCPGCTRPLRQARVGQRSTFFCVHCQH